MKNMKSIMPKSEDKPFVIGKHEKIATGHQPRAVGCGPHKDKRDKRCRTRSAQTRRSLED